MSAPPTPSEKETPSPAPAAAPAPSSPPTPAATTNTPPAPAPGPGTTSSTMKKLNRRSSKPIINWLQRKLTVGHRGEKKAKPAVPADLGNKRRLSATNRVTSAPLNGAASKQQNTDREKPIPELRKTISLNSTSNRPSGDEISSYPSSKKSADEDASVRPLAPSSPMPPSPTPSRSPSRSSSSYLSHSKTFSSMAASTKPTTLLSIDLNAGGMAHIAQAPPTATAATTAPQDQDRLSPGAHSRSGSGANAAQVNNVAPNTSSTNGDAHAQPTTGMVGVSVLQAPLHTSPHPRNNPRPSSPPLDNASLLTLASSAYAMRPPLSSAPASALDSLSHFTANSTYADAESTTGSNFPMSDEGYDAVDASVRALRPRSSRRGSWESEDSKWSARMTGGGGTPSRVGGWGPGSVRTGTFSAEAEAEADEDVSMDTTQEKYVGTGEDGDAVPPADLVSPSTITEKTIVDGDTKPEEAKEDETPVPPTLGPRKLSTETVAGRPSNGSSPVSPPSAVVNGNGSAPPPSTFTAEDTAEKQKPGPLSLSTSSQNKDEDEEDEDNASPKQMQSGFPSPALTAMSEFTDGGGTDMWHTPPATPGPLASPPLPAV